MTTAIDTVERLLCERYNVRSLDGLGALPEAIAAARHGDLAPLREALDGRDLYQWGPLIMAALRGADSVVVDEEEGSREIPSLPDEPSSSSEPEPEPDIDGPVANAEEVLEQERPRRGQGALEHRKSEGRGSLPARSRERQE